MTILIIGLGVFVAIVLLAVFTGMRLASKADARDDEQLRTVIRPRENGGVSHKRHVPH